MSVHKTQLNGMTAAWLLPIAPCVVASATGAEVARVLVNQDHALWTLTTSFVLWGIGAPFAFIVLALYFHRLAVHKLPPREVIVSCFLPLSPLGMGSYAYVFSIELANC